jgi:hypothetical protein
VVATCLIGYSAFVGLHVHPLRTQSFLHLRHLSRPHAHGDSGRVGKCSRVSVPVHGSVEMSTDSPLARITFALHLVRSFSLAYCSLCKLPVPSWSCKRVGCYPVLRNQVRADSDDWLSIWKAKRLPFGLDSAWAWLHRRERRAYPCARHVRCTGILVDESQANLHTNQRNNSQQNHPDGARHIQPERHIVFNRSLVVCRSNSAVHALRLDAVLELVLGDVGLDVVHRGLGNVANGFLGEEGLVARDDHVREGKEASQRVVGNEVA